MTPAVIDALDAMPARDVERLIAHAQRRLFPPGTSKWDKVEHRLFSAITQDWRGKPLISHETVVNLIAATTTRMGLKVRSELDINDYPKGVKVGDAEMRSIYHQPDTFHGEWDYSLLPRLRLPLTEAVIS